MVTSTELAEKFEVSVRTIYRDIRKLEDAGVPVVTIEGKGYSLMDGYFVSPIQFTEKEANALITAQHLISQTKDSSFAHSFAEALTKIKAVFKSSVLEKSELLSNNIFVANNTLLNISSNALAEIQVAITNFSLLEIYYKKANDYEISVREIEPYALYSYEQKWLLIAWCHMRNEYRSFRIDRIQSFKILNKKFSPKKFDLHTFFSSC